MTKSKILIYISISFTVGVLLASAVNLPRQDVYIGIGLFAVAAALLFVANQKFGALCALLLLCAGLGALRLQISQKPNEFENLFLNKQQLEGYVAEDVDIRSTEQLITFSPKGFSQNILISQRLGQKFFYGDWIVAIGTPSEAQNFGDFDYQKYLERYNIYATMAYPKILMLKSNQLSPIKEFLLKVKAAFLQRLSGFLDEPQNSLAVGILIGGHGNLPDNIVNNFSVTGVSHIIAVSGFNITIIVVAVSWLLYLIGRRAGFWLALSLIISFIIIAGASASVVRAGIMGFLFLLSMRVGRQYSIAPSLFFAALIMLIGNPKILFWDVGFQMSFAATVGIIYFYPVLDRIAQKIPADFGLKTIILTTLSAIFATLPFIMYNFGVLSLSAPLVNVLVLPTVPWAMLFGFLTVLPVAGPGSAMLANWLLVYILKVTSFFAGLPYSSLAVQISAWQFWLLLGAVLGLYLLLKTIAARFVEVEENIQV